jgi:NADH-quinone oxidoreductase subunit L
MTVPLMVLAFLSLVGGFVGIPTVIVEGADRFGHFLDPVFAPAKAILEHGHHAEHYSAAAEWALMIVSVGIGFFGLFFARWMYVTRPSAAEKAVEKFGSVHTLVYNKYWMDEIYDALFVNSIVGFSKFLWKYVDEGIVDGIVNGVATVTRGIGGALRRVQTGLVKDYAFSVLVGVLVIIGYLVLK